MRQRNLKILAAEADARWAAKPSFLDTPGKAQGHPIPGTQLKDPGGYAPSTGPAEKEGVQNAVGGGLDDSLQGTDKKLGQALEEQERRPAERTHRPDIKEKKKDKDDPWKQARGGPSEEWQPQAWTPTPKR